MFQGHIITIGEISPPRWRQVQRRPAARVLAPCHQHSCRLQRWSLVTIGPLFSLLTAALSPGYICLVPADYIALTLTVERRVENKDKERV